MDKPSLLALSDILSDPLTQQSLVSHGKAFIDPKSKRKYQVEDAVLLARFQDFEQVKSKAKVHLDYGTDFEYRDHYQLDAEYYDYFKSPSHGGWLDEIARIHDTILAELPQNSSLILDIGCGNGWFAKETLPKGHRVISTDVSTVNPKKVTARYPDQNHFGLVADAYYLPVAKNSLDVVVASEVIEHVPDPVLFVDRLYQHLKPGGKLIVTTPYAQDVQYHMCVHCDRPTPTDAHIYHFYEGNIDRLIPAGAKFRARKFYNSYIPKLRLYKLLQYLPFKVWSFVDDLASMCFGKPTRYLLIFEKPK